MTVQVAEPKNLVLLAADSLGGFVSGSLSVIIGHPFDTIKVRLQAGHSPYASAFDCLRSTVRAEGARALFQGLLSPLLTNSAMNAVTFATWQQTLRLLHFDEKNPNAPLSKVFAAGATAGIVQCSIATPMELVRSRLQVQSKACLQAAPYKGNIDCLRRIFHAEGVAGLYRGNVSMMLREGPAYGVYFSVYEATKRALCPSLEGGKSEPMWVEALGGATTGALTWATVMPIDVLSTRVQCAPETAAAEQKTLQYHAREVMRLHGVLGFYRGLGAAVARGVVLNAAVFPVYETIVRVVAGDR